MKKYLLKFSSALFLSLLMFSAVETQAKTETLAKEELKCEAFNWTYSTVISGITYKLHLAQEKGTWTIQVYDSKSNSWTYGQVLSSDPSRGYWRIKDGGGKVWDLTTYGNDYCIIKDSTGYSVKYWAE